MKQMTFVQAMKDFFGLRPGATGALDFMQEIKALDADERAWFRENLATVGYEIVNA